MKPFANNTGKRGFTLMELLVYMAIVGIVVVIAGQVYSDSTKMRVRTQSMIEAQSNATNVSALMVEDIRQTGSKSSKEDAGFFQQDSLYIDPANTTANLRDSSSFILKKGCSNCNMDTLTVRRIRYNEAGKFQAVEEVKWIRNGKKLLRGCRGIQKTSSVSSDDCPVAETISNYVEIADNVDSIKIALAKPRIESTASKSAEELSHLLPSTDPTVVSFRLLPRSESNFQLINTDPADGGEAVTLFGFATNYDFTTNSPILSGKKANQVFVAAADGTTGSWKTQCKRVKLEANTEYEISFSVPHIENDSRMFCPGRDFAAVGFRTLDGDIPDGLQDFNFYFSASPEETAERVFRFIPNSDANSVCMAFTFARYSPFTDSDKDKVTIRNVTLKKIASSNFNFDESYQPLVADKKNIKALYLKLIMSKNGEASKQEQVITIPSNGPRD